MKKNRKNYVYEVEVSEGKHEEEFSMELFEMVEDAATFGPHKKINSFDELLDWNEQLEEE
jgi:hypothetical protein